MKTSKLLVILFLSIFILYKGTSQDRDRSVLKVSYTTDNMSDFFIGMLKKQIADPIELSELLNKVHNYKIYHSLYQNLRTNESVFVLDSINRIEEISTVGHDLFTLRDKGKELYGKETFMGKEFSFKGPSNTLKWAMTDEKKTIKDYSCRKAVLDGKSDIYVWFTTDVPVDSGPYIYYGLPGLVLESNGYFQTISATSISYEDDKVFNEKFNEISEKIRDRVDESLAEVIAKKENFKMMVEKGKN